MGKDVALHEQQQIALVPEEIQLQIEASSYSCRCSFFCFWYCSSPFPREFLFLFLSAVSVSFSVPFSFLQSTLICYLISFAVTVPAFSPNFALFQCLLLFPCLFPVPDLYIPHLICVFALIVDVVSLTDPIPSYSVHVFFPCGFCFYLPFLFKSMFFFSCRKELNSFFLKEHWISSPTKWHIYKNHDYLLFLSVCFLLQ